ncbi:hypothetical protein RJV14_01615 [Buchnera aphidicola (Kurisakia onigurumii)]|uniref:hypothetical protein n=1 Tax=Buchnera aphidicola TaxID=9 RepID=UPI0031B72E0A
MKRLLFSIIIYFFLSNLVFARNIILQNDINKNININKNTKRIEEFFSFFCPYCYNLEYQYQFNYFLRNKYSNQSIINSYHVNISDSYLEKILSKAWIIAKELHIENKVLIPIYTNIQEKKYIKNFSTLKNIFIKNSKIQSKIYDMYWNSISIEIRLKQEYDIIKKFHIIKIPTIYINQKYLLELNDIYQLPKKKFLEKQTRSINFLLKKI